MKCVWCGRRGGGGGGGLGVKKCTETDREEVIMKKKELNSPNAPDVNCKNQCLEFKHV